MTTATAASKAGTKAAKSAKKEAANTAGGTTTGAAPAPKKMSKKKAAAAAALAANNASISTDGGDGNVINPSALPTTGPKSTVASSLTRTSLSAANQNTTEIINVLEDEIRNVKKEVDNDDIKQIRAHYIK